MLKLVHYVERSTTLYIVMIGTVIYIIVSSYHKHNKSLVNHESSQVAGI